MTDPRVPLVLDTQWVQARRGEGGAIWVLDQTGRSWHQDDAVRAVTGDVDHVRKALRPEQAGELMQLMKRHFGQPITAWLSLDDDWFRVQTYWINVFVVLAIWPEPDVSQHHVHVG